MGKLASRLDTFHRFAWILVAFILVSPLIIFIPNHPFPMVAGPIYTVRLAGAFLALLCLLEMPRSFIRPQGPVLVSSSLVLCALFLATIFSVDRELSFQSTPDRMTGSLDQALWTLCAIALMVAVQDWRRVFRWAAIVGAVLAIGGILDSVVYGNPRPQSLTGNPGFLAIYEVGTLLAAVVLAGTNLRRAWAWGIVVGLAIVALELTDTRAAILGAFVGLIVLWSSSRWTRYAAIAAALMLAVLVAFGDSGDRLVHTTTTETSVAHRTEFARISWRAVLDHPFAGYGPNTYGIVHQEHAGEDFVYADYPHNMLLEELLAKGLLSMPTFALLLFVGRRLWRGRSDDLALLSLAIGAALAVYAAFWFLSWLMGLWCVLVLGYALHRERGVRTTNPSLLASASNEELVLRATLLDVAENDRSQRNGDGQQGDHIHHRDERQEER